MSDVPLGDFYVRGMTPSVFSNFFDYNTKRIKRLLIVSCLNQIFNNCFTSTQQHSRKWKKYSHVIDFQRFIMKGLPLFLRTCKGRYSNLNNQTFILKKIFILKVINQYFFNF